MADPSPHDLINQIQQQLKTDGDVAQQKLSKREACELARKLWLSLEEPGDTVDRLIYQPMENALIQVAIDLGVYKYLVEQGSPVSTSDVAQTTKCDPVLMQRLLRCFAALSHIDEVDVGMYRANKFSQAFTTTKGIAGSANEHRWAARAWTGLPAYLKSKGYENPTDSMDTAIQQVFNTDKHFFEFLVTNNHLDIFQTFMSCYRDDRAEFLDVFPADERLIKGGPEKDDDVLLVDVGGGHGHDIEKFVAKFPNKKGRMVLQDQANVVSEVKSDVMETMAHDFFISQPVKGARAYYFRMIFHDWPDRQSITILKHIVDAMKPGYSKLLINDIVLPNKGATRLATMSDINMMTLLAAMERSEVQWRDLLEGVGLKNIKIWPSVPESVIEAEI